MSMAKALCEEEMTADQIYKTMMELNGEDHHGAMYVREAAVKMAEKLEEEQPSSD